MTVECARSDSFSLFERTHGESSSSLSHQGLRVWLNYTIAVFVSGGWVGEQKLRSVVDNPAHPPLARQRCKHIIKFATVKHAMVPVKINTETGSDKTGCEKVS